MRTLFIFIKLLNILRSLSKIIKDNRLKFLMKVFNCWRTYNGELLTDSDLHVNGDEKAPMQIRFSKPMAPRQNRRHVNS